jgi:hypothetical protein
MGKAVARRVTQADRCLIYRDDGNRPREVAHPPE